MRDRIMRFPRLSSQSDLSEGMGMEQVWARRLPPQLLILRRQGP